MSVLQNILPYVSLVNKKLDYVKTDSTYFIFELKGYKLPKNIVDKNSGKILKERTAIILLDINQQVISMQDYIVEDYGNAIRFKLPKSNFPYTLNSNDVLNVTGTFSK